MDQERVRQAVAQLDYDWREFTIEDFIQHVERHLGREIIINGLPLEGISGICISQGLHDYIFYDIRRHPAMQLHTRLHELAHVVLGHKTLHQFHLKSRDLAAISLHVNTRQHRKRSDARDQREEDEAEYFAILVQQAVAGSQRLHELTLTDSDDDVYLPPFTGKFSTRS